MPAERASPRFRLLMARAESETMRARRIETVARERVATARGVVVADLTEARGRLGWTLRETARRVGCSAAMRSDLERRRRWSDWIVDRLLTLYTQGARDE